MPLFGETFIPYTLEQLSAAPVYKTKYEHIHDCAMRVCTLDSDAMQPAIMEYIIENETNVPAFLLNDVPMYVAGYMRREQELCYTPNMDGS